MWVPAVPTPVVAKWLALRPDTIGAMSSGSPASATVRRRSSLRQFPENSGAWLGAPLNTVTRVAGVAEESFLPTSRVCGAINESCGKLHEVEEVAQSWTMATHGLYRNYLL